jgi:tetratricopeptide (TPR) repeat protein
MRREFRKFVAAPQITITMERMSDTWLREPVLLTTYRRFLESQDTVGFVYTVSKSYGPGTLERLYRNGDPETRRAAIFALGLIGDFNANQTLGQAMQDPDAAVRQLAALACRSVWNRFGDKALRRQLADIVRLNATREYRRAAENATALLEQIPDMAEAWYQRGNAWFQLGEVSRAIHDWNQCLELNPYQFVAATAIGNAYLQLHSRASALEAFERALRLNPDLEHVQAQIVALKRQLDDNR